MNIRYEMNVSVTCNVHVHIWGVQCVIRADSCHEVNGDGDASLHEYDDDGDSGY